MPQPAQEQSMKKGKAGWWLCYTFSHDAQGLKGFSSQSQPLSFPTYINIKYGTNGGTSIMNIYHPMASFHISKPIPGISLEIFREAWIPTTYMSGG